MQKIGERNAKLCCEPFNLVSYLPSFTREGDMTLQHLARPVDLIMTNKIIMESTINLPVRRGLVLDNKLPFIVFSETLRFR